MIRRIVVLSAFLLVVFAGAANAQYVPGEPGIIVDPGSTTTGGTIEVQGSGCPRNVEVTIYVGDVKVATTSTSPDDGTGSFDVPNIVLPPEITPGDYTVHAYCGDLDLTAVLSVSAAATTVATVTTTSTLPVTGSDSGLLVKTGAALIAAGGLVLLVTRRRRAAL